MADDAKALPEEAADCPSTGAGVVCPSVDGFTESAAWESVGEGWRPLHGRFAQQGLSIEWHEFKVKEAFDWAPSFHPQSLEICLNLAGKATIRHGRRDLELGPKTMAFYCMGDEPIQAERLPAKESHQFMTVELDLRALGSLLGENSQETHPLIRDALAKKRFSSGAGAAATLLMEQDRWVKQVLNPPVPQAAEKLWMTGRVQEILAQCLFIRPESEALFCDRQKHLARARVEKAILILRERLAEPPSLEQLGRLVGCSHYYLSRTFSKETGSTIQQYLRRLRVEKAAELLKSGRFNVTEAALEVGYNSMSHFSQAFCHEMGVCPALYQKSGPAVGRS